MSVKGDIVQDFKWLADLILHSAANELPRMLIFFNNVNHLTDAYQYVTVHAKLHDKMDPVVAMFSLLTKSSRKTDIITKLSSGLDPNLKIVLCSSSLSMGMNLKTIDYVLHYGPPTTADAFLQETGRVSREANSHGHSIMMTYARMASGRQLDTHMKKYCHKSECLRDILLQKFGCKKPDNQSQCCNVCESDISCTILELIESSFNESITDSFSDSDSVASVGEIDDFEVE